MILLNYFKNTFKNKNIKAIIYLIISYAFNMAIFWLIYEKLFKQSHFLIYGTIFYIIGFLIFSRPVCYNAIRNLGEKEYILDNKMFPKTMEAFEKVKSAYIASGDNFAKNVNLNIFDEGYFTDSYDVVPYGISEISINAVTDILPEEINIGRLAMCMDMIKFGCGERKVIPFASNPFYLIIIALLSLIRISSASFYRSLGWKFAEQILNVEDKILGTVLGAWIVLGENCCALKINQDYFDIVNNGPLYEEKMEYLKATDGEN